MSPAATATRPRVEGERATEIHEAVIRLLVEHGYDKLTFDAVAAEVRASKATLYRKWSSKATSSSRPSSRRSARLSSSARPGRCVVTCSSVPARTAVSPKGYRPSSPPSCPRCTATRSVWSSRPGLRTDERAVRRHLPPRPAARARSGRRRPGAVGPILPAMAVHQAVVFAGRDCGVADITAIVDDVVLLACRATLP